MPFHFRDWPGLTGFSDCTTSRYSEKIVQRSARVSSKLIWPLLSGNSYIVPRVSPVASCDRRATFPFTALSVVCAVYFFLLSLLPLSPAISMLRSALDVRRGLEFGNQIPGSHTVARNALLTAIVGLIFAIVPILQRLTKVLRLRGEHLLGRESARRRVPLRTLPS